MQQLEIRVSGRVQGVGFRPFVWRLATRAGLTGWVKNDGAGVLIALAGEAGQLSRFLDDLHGEAPTAARIDSVHTGPYPEPLPDGFSIRESEAGPAHTMVGPDMPTCPDCLAELFDPANRRYRYPFINCTQCGPRYTITRRIPYDRANTSMAGFVLCPACQQEYASPADRRFHAEPNACPVCGPKVWLVGEGETARTEPRPDPITEALNRLKAGEIVAIKSLGGFHLAVDARNPAAVARLRARKHRPGKPLALMLANIASLGDYAAVMPGDVARLTSLARPIVLLSKAPGADVHLPGIAPGVGELGVMLPYTPLHWLLFHEAAGRPAGTNWLDEAQELALVMTSANPSGEPMVADNADALARLTGLADVFLQHDRDIVIRCDDSVLRGDILLRRARGFVPDPIPVSASGNAPTVLALGGHLKVTVAVLRGGEAWLSEHVGDLDNPAAIAAHEEVVTHLLDLLQTRPDAVACDLHPDFVSTRLAARLAAEWGVPLVQVQHHHAHIAAVFAEYGVELAGDESAFGLALDGYGYGGEEEATIREGKTSGRAWGGEALRVTGAGYQRVGHLAPLPLLGGDRAAREPWRMAAGVLAGLGRGAEIATRFPDEALAPALMQLLTTRPALHATTSLGRYFDAAAALLGVCTRQSFEAEAAMQLEALAAAYGDIEPLADGWQIQAGILDLGPLWRWLADCRDAAQGAAAFHATLAAALADWTATLIGDEPCVALAGGCCANRVLLRGLSTRLEHAGLAVLTARAAPPNDGGLALGQAWVARGMLASMLLRSTSRLEN